MGKYARDMDRDSESIKVITFPTYPTLFFYEVTDCQKSVRLLDPCTELTYEILRQSKTYLFMESLAAR